MANLTITVDEEVLKKARIRALQQGTSVNAVLAERLAGYAGESSQQLAATRRLVALSGLASPSVKKRRRPSRDELHER